LIFNTVTKGPEPLSDKQISQRRNHVHQRFRRFSLPKNHLAQNLADALPLSPKNTFYRLAR
jgi:hypothetical protein